MPELPEVETIKNELRGLVIGRRVERVDVRDPRVVRYSVSGSLERDLTGESIQEVHRRAKYLLLWLSSGRYLVIHLIITGQLLLVRADTPLRPSTRLVLHLDDGRQLRLVDSSHLARVYLVQPSELDTRLHFNRLGPEPLSDEFSVEELAERLRGRGASIKSLLLDQHVLAGLGNIYSDEVLFRARIHPAEPAKNLSLDQVRRLYRAIRETLREAIAYRGTTTRTYRDVLGRKGSYQQRLLVFERAGQPCHGCSGSVQRITVAGRQTYVCPSCQILSEQAKAA